MRKSGWLQGTDPAFRLMIATSWLAPDAWRLNQEKAIREAIEAAPDWTGYLRLVDRHRTPALSWAALSRVQGVPLPEHVRLQLQRRSHACQMQAVQHCLILAEVLKGFNRAGIPIMSMKGVILSLELYGDVGLRQSRDLDLAVARDDLERAQVCLENMGWRLDSSTWFPLTPRQWESFLRHEHHLDFIHSQAGHMLELHWRNQWETPALTRARWTRSISAIWQGCSLRAMNPGDLTLYLCSHGCDHAWSRAKWLGDLARAHLVGRLNWEAALVEARETGQEAVLLAARELLNQVYGLPLPQLAGNPSIDLPSPLFEIPLSVLQHTEERQTASSPRTLGHRLRMSRYERLLRSRKTWRESLSQFFYCRADFKDLHLPDALFWAYTPMRPILLACRWARQAVNQARPGSA